MHPRMYLIPVVLGIVCLSCNQPGNRFHYSTEDILPIENSSYTDQNTIQYLLNLLHEESYFRFNETYVSCRTRLPEKYKLYFDIFQYDLFGFPDLLEAQDNLFLRKYYREMTDFEKALYHFRMISHYQKRYTYYNAFSEVRKLEEFVDLMDSLTLEDLQQYQELFSVLLQQLPIRVTIQPGDSILMEKIRGHYYLPVSINGNSIKMVFDTGSGRSLISRSLSEKFGLQVLETKTKVLGTTGTWSASNLGIANTMTIGNTLLEHVVFHVIEDSLLGVPEYSFQFDGLVGMDILYPLGSVTINTDGLLRINQKSEEHLQENMTLSSFENRITVKFQDHVLPMKLDAGAWMSIFTWRFYELFKSTSLNNFKIDTKEYGGIGGTISYFDMVHLDSMMVFTGNNSALLADAWIHTKSIHRDPVSYYGLMGQDFIDQFEDITLNFCPNSIQYTPRN